MKRTKIFLSVAVLLCAALFFPGCSTDPEDEPNYGGAEKALPGISLATADGVKYYSLSTGTEVTGADINTNKWDIAFSRTRLIYTNSGASAKGGGNGGVWHTEKTDLGAVSYGEQKEFKVGSVSHNVDVAEYLYTGMGPAPTAKTILNVMTYVGYEHGNGSTNDITGYTAGSGDYSNYPANGPLSGYKYDQHQYYNSAGMGSYAGNNQVYIIRHGDGEHYSKIQIVYAYLSADLKDEWRVTYQNF
jgi:hypothetical protein